jgi:hypothetical protein
MLPNTEFNSPSPPPNNKGEFMTYKRGLVTHDFHTPYEDKKSWNAVKKYVEDVGHWDYWIFSELMDLRELSKFDEGMDIPDKLDVSYAYAREFLGEAEELVRRKNPDCKIIYEQGNHEFRATLEANKLKNRKWKGFLNVPKQLKLNDMGIRWVKSWEGQNFHVGKAHFSHGIYVGLHHAKKHVLTWGECIYYGHTHDVQEYPLVVQGKNRTLVGKSLGCMCQLSPEYMRNRPSDWQQAFAVFMFMPNGNFTEHTVRLFNHKFIMPSGDEYDGRLIK